MLRAPGQAAPPPQRMHVYVWPCRCERMRKAAAHASEQSSSILWRPVGGRCALAKTTCEGATHGPAWEPHRDLHPAAPDWPSQIRGPALCRIRMLHRAGRAFSRWSSRSNVTLAGPQVACRVWECKQQWQRQRQWPRLRERRALTTTKSVMQLCFKPHYTAHKSVLSASQDPS